MRRHRFVFRMKKKNVFPRVRRKQTRSLDEICNRLALPRGTVYYWIKDIPLQRPRKTNLAPAYAATFKKFRLIREDSYKQGLLEYDTLVANPTFRDFVTLFMTEGYNQS